MTAARFGAFEADLRAAALFRNGRRIPLQRHPFEALALLIERAGDVVTREELSARLWLDGTVVDFEHGLNTAMRKLRRALGDSVDAPRFIETVPGRGYRFVAAIETTVCDPENAGCVLTVADDGAADGTALRRLLGESARSWRGELVADDSRGSFAVFATADGALHCAVALRGAGGKDGLSLRLGIERGTGAASRARAIRLCDRAASGEILVSAALAESVGANESFRLRDREPLGDGDGAAIAVVSAEPSGVPPATLLARPPFVGRERELGTLARRLDAAREGRGGLVLVAGEPGVGKTRLVEEFARRARLEGALVLAGRCTQAEWSASYGAIGDAIAGHVRTAELATLRDALDPATASVLAKLVPILRQRLPELPEPAALRPVEERQRLFDSVAQALARLAKRSAVVLTVDDLQWADSATLAMLAHAVRTAPGSAVLLLGSYRDVEVDRAHPLARWVETLAGAGVETLAVGGLGVEQIQAWLESIAPGEELQATAEGVHRVTAGNPFFLRELLLHWARRRRDGTSSTRLPLDLEALGIPSGIRAMVERRLALLSEEARRFLSTASAFAGAFHFAATTRAVGLDEERALDALDEALEAQLVRPSGGADDYEFAHALIRQVLHDALAPARRVRIHRGLAEELGAERLAGERSAEIAHHYHQSREVSGAERGVPFAVAAADRAERSADFEGAARLLRMALDMIPRVDPQRPRLLGRLALALAWSGDLAESPRVAGEAGESIALAEGASAARDFLADAADAIWLRSYSPMAWLVAMHGLRHAGERRDWTWVRLASHQLLANEAMGPTLRALPADTPLRREVFRGLLANRQHVPPFEMNELWRSALFESREQAIALAGDRPLALVYWIGDYQTGLARYREGVREAVARGEVAAAAILFATISLAEMALGDLAGAEASARRAHEWAQRTESSPMVEGTIRGHALELARILGAGLEQPLARLEAHATGSFFEGSFVGAQIAACLAPPFAFLGRRKEALAALERAMPAIEQGPSWAACFPATVCFGADALWLLGESSAHLATIERALREKVLAPDFRMPNVDARLSLARICALTERWGEAQGWLDRAREVLEAQGAVPLRAIADLDEAEMLVRRAGSGDRERARPLLEAAGRRLAALGMPGWATRAEAARSSCG